MPAYSFPENRQDLSVLRIVVRAGMTMDMADLLLTQLGEETADLQSLSGPLPSRRPVHARASLTDPPLTPPAQGGQLTGSATR